MGYRHLDFWTDVSINSRSSAAGGGAGTVLHMWHWQPQPVTNYLQPSNNNLNFYGRFIFMLAFFYTLYAAMICANYNLPGLRRYHKTSYNYRSR